MFEGSFDEVNRLFYENEWSDGLPIVPPTLERIETFLQYTDRDPHDLIGTLLPQAKRAALTIYRLARTAEAAAGR